ncbi:MAG TPA: two-component regulator propeller domain-containing protein [Pyrinomonadaceae bacterium]
MQKKRSLILSEIQGRLFVRCFCVALVLLCFFNSRAERLPVKLFTSADGLGSSFVNNLMRDSRGFLWLATRDGLSRFDGSRFITYQVGTKDAPPGIENIYETSRGVYWITTTSGLYRYNPNRTPAAPPAENNDRPVLNAEFINERRDSFYEDKDGKLWSIGGELNLLEESGGKVSFRKIELNLPADPATSFHITDFRQARDGSFWIATYWGVVRLLPDGRKIFYSVENTRTDLFASITEDSKGRIWLARMSGIYVFKPEPLTELSATENLTIRRLDAIAAPEIAKQPRMPEKSGEIFKLTGVEGFNNSQTKFLYKSSDGHVWISSGEGIVEFDGRSFHSFTAAQGFTGGIGRMVEDLDGNLWLGGDKNLVRLDRGGLTTYDAADGFETLSILALGESRDGQLYAASSGFLINRFDGKKFQTFRPPLPGGARAMWNSNTLFLDSRNEWWFLTNENLYRFASTDDSALFSRQKPLGIYGSRDGLPGSRIFHSFEDSRGDVWFSTRAAPDADDAQFGLSKFNRATEIFHLFSKTENYPARKSASAFAEDFSGNLWIGFYEGGLVRYAGGRFTEITDGLPEGMITALHLDKKGRLWLSTASSGASRIDDPSAESPRFVSYKTENGLSSNNVRSITEDDFGQIYFGTARGVDRITPETAHIKHYSTSDGLAGDFVQAAFCDRSGALWFGTSNGLSRLVPEQDAKSTAPPVWLSGLRIAGESRIVSELGSAEINNLELAPAQNNLQIDFFGLDFSPNSSLRYQFRLEGADADWSPPTEQRTVNYANLSAGTYRFLVRAVNADGIASEQPAIISFKLLSPVWARWWFIASAFLLVGAGVFALDRFRVKKTRQVNSALGLSRESETRYRTLAETASDGIVTIDEASRIVYVNEAVEKIFGYPAAELLGAPLTILMPERLRPSHEAGLRRYLATNVKNLVWAAIELPGQHKSGATIPLELSFGEFEKDGRRFFTGIARDISERKKAEAALRKSREERFAELERVRKRIATDLHDDIGSSLTQISLLSEVVNRQIGAQETPVTKPLSMIAETSRELVDAMSDIVWAINPRKDNLSDLTGRMHRFAADVLTAGNINLKWHAPDPDKSIPIGANVRREIFLIFKESINNVVKHSNGTEVEAEIRLDAASLELSLRDNGKGFDVSGRSDGHGLGSVRERANALGGDFQIVSQTGKGTGITLKVPLEQNPNGDRAKH